MKMDQEYKYDIFISYRHKPLDETITRNTFNRLESYKLPKKIMEKGGQNIKRVFRDTEELAVSRILTDTIQKALSDAKCLVIVCSTDTPSSEWVDREVATFIELGKSQNIYPLLISGTPEESFPPSLKLVPDITDRVMDVRDESLDPKKILEKEDTELLKVIARVAGCGFAELSREHKLRKRRRTMAGWTSAAAVFALVAAVCLSFWNRAEEYRAGAERAQASSMMMLDRMTYTIPDKLTGYTGTYSRIADILEKNTIQINEILELSRDKDSVEDEIASNYEKLATAYTTLGFYEEAEEAENNAIDIYSKRAEKSLEGAETELASAYNNLGRLYNISGRYESASGSFSKALDLLPENREDKLLLASVLSNSGANWVSLGDYKKAGDCFKESSSLFEDYTAEKGYVSREYADSVYNYGIALHRAGNYTEAEGPLEQSLSLYNAIFEAAPIQNNVIKLLRAKSAAGANLTQLARFEEAMDIYRSAENQIVYLSDAENIEARMLLAEMYNQYGLCYNMQEIYTEADIWFRKSAELYKELSDKTGSDTSKASAALSCFNVGVNSFNAGEYDISRSYLKDGLDLLNPVKDRMGSYYSSLYYAWLSYYEIIFEKDFPQALRDSYTAVSLQPDSVMACHYYGYSLMYNGYYEEAGQVFDALAALGEGTVRNIILDFEALTKYGMHADYMDTVLERISDQSGLPGKL